MRHENLVWQTQNLLLVQIDHERDAFRCTLHSDDLRIDMISLTLLSSWIAHFHVPVLFRAIADYQKYLPKGFTRDLLSRMILIAKLSIIMSLELNSCGEFVYYFLSLSDLKKGSSLAPCVHLMLSCCQVASSFVKIPMLLITTAMEVQF